MSNVPKFRNKNRHSLLSLLYSHCPILISAIIKYKNELQLVFVQSIYKTKSLFIKNKIIVSLFLFMFVCFRLFILYSSMLFIYLFYILRCCYVFLLLILMLILYLRMLYLCLFYTYICLFVIRYISNCSIISLIIDIYLKML